MDPIYVHGHQMLRPLSKLPSFERNKIREEKIKSFFPPWINKKLKHKRLVKT
jgi:hypothetical protein